MRMQSNGKESCLTKMTKKTLIKKLLRKFPNLGNPPDLSDPEVYRKYCIEYGKAIRPGLEAVDRMLARSKASMFTKVVM